MTHVLLLDSSARIPRSLSRRLTTEFFNLWRARRPEDRIVRRDLARDPPPHVTEEWIAAAFAAPEERSPGQRRALEASDRLIDEVLAADVIAIGTPMYNYGMPSTLKAWVDQVVRIGRTFSFDLARGDEPIEPIQTGKSLVVMTASGEGGPSGPNASLNHLDGHLAAALRLIGISYRHTMRIEYQEFDDERHEAGVMGNRSNRHATSLGSDEGLEPERLLRLACGETHQGPGAKPLPPKRPDACLQSICPSRLLGVQPRRSGRPRDGPLADIGAPCGGSRI